MKFDNRKCCQYRREIHIHTHAMSLSSSMKFDIQKVIFYARLLRARLNIPGGKSWTSHRHQTPVHKETANALDSFFLEIWELNWINLCLLLVNIIFILRNITFIFCFSSFYFLLLIQNWYFIVCTKHKFFPSFSRFS